MTRTCSLCKETKPGEEFYTDKKSTKCKVCKRRESSKYYYAEGGKEKRYSAQLRVRYGVTRSEYDDLFNKGNHTCQICGERATDLDHCHDKSFVRGILCGRCNKGLGLFRDRPDLLHKAAEYLNGTLAER